LCEENIQLRNQLQDARQRLERLSDAFTSLSSQVQNYVRQHTVVMSADTHVTAQCDEQIKPPSQPSGIDLSDSAGMAGSLLVSLRLHKEQVDSLLAKAQALLEQADKRNHVEIRQERVFGQIVDASLLTSYHPGQ
jgi:hypothetical protein